MLSTLDEFLLSLESHHFDEIHIEDKTQQKEFIFKFFLWKPYFMSIYRK